MAVGSVVRDMGEEGRALLTDTEREILRGDRDVTSNYRYKVQSLARQRVRKRLREDIEVLQENEDELFEEIQEIVCEG